MRLERLAGAGGGGAQQDPGEVRAAAREFESLFLHQLMKGMRQTIPKDEDGEEGWGGGGYGGEVFTDLLDMEYAKMGAEAGGMGLAELVATQLGAEPGSEPVRSMEGASMARAAEGLRRYQGRTFGGSGMLLPVDGRVTSEYGMRKLEHLDVHDDEHRLHAGLDLGAPHGAPIRAALGGQVVFAGERGGYGNTVIVDHGNGLTTLYAHASELLVRAGETVGRGMPIAKVGSTGRSTGPHLHFEVRREGRPLDPAKALGLR